MNSKVFHYCLIGVRLITFVAMGQRGTRLDTGNRFTSYSSEPFDDGWERFAGDPDPRTRIVEDLSRTPFSVNNSPDIPFTHSVNPYRGCEHGCAYCYARPTHEYLGFNAGLDFESVIVVKRDAPRLVREAMMKPSWKPTSVSMSGVTDPYQPLEKKLRITRGILETMLDFRNPVGIITKNGLVCRDLDVLAELAGHGCVAVMLSMTTLDRDLARRMEPRTSAPELRLRAIERLVSAGVPAGVMVAPVIPGLNEQEIPAILSAAAGAGARWAGHVLLRLPLAVKPIFLDWLEREEPGRRAKVRSALREMKGETLNRSDFRARMSGQGARARAIGDLFRMTTKRLGLNVDPWPTTTENFRRPGAAGQMNLF